MYASLTLPGGLAGELELLQRQMDQLFGHGASPSSIRASQRGAFPPINMGSSPDAVEIYAFAPGVDIEKVDVSVDRGLLTIAGERNTALPADSDKVSIFAAERFDGAFRRVVSLPEDADPTRVEARYRDGILRIVVPKRESSKPRRIEVKESR
jgi:HSP20 family protein